MQEIKEMKDALYQKMLEPSLLSKIVSVALAATSLIYIIASIASLASRPTRPVPGLLSASLVIILLLTILCLGGSMIQLLVEKRSFIAEIMTNESRSWINQFWRLAIGVYISFSFIWFVIMQFSFFSDDNQAYIYWRSMYFIELFWIAQTYSLLALMATYIIYLVIEMKLNKSASVPESSTATRFE